MGLNKFITKKGRVLLDLTEDTVTPETLGKGVTAHDRSGEPIVGTNEGGLPIEVATEIQMNTLLLLEETEVGAVYKYTGTTTSKYENGALYVVEEEVKSYSLTITNAGNSSHEFMFYGVDTDVYDDLQQLDYRETVTVDNVKNFVYCSCDYIFKRDNVVLNNCTIEWISNGECKLYPTGDNASATLEVYD